LRSKAKRLEEKAAWHYRAGGPDPPAAAAMAMPVPQGSSQTSAVGQQGRLDHDLTVT